MRVERAVHQRFAGRDALAFLHVDVDAARQRVFLLRAVVADDDDLALALGRSRRYLTMPSISLMTAVSRGLRASNSSTTRGRPPVMSLVLVVSRGILASTSPACTVVAVPHHQVRARRHQVALLARACAVLGTIMTRRLRLLVRRIGDHPLRQAGDFVHLLRDRSRPRCRSLNCTVPPTSVRMEKVYGSHSSRIWLGLDRGAVLDQDAWRRRPPGSAPSRGPCRPPRR